MTPERYQKMTELFHAAQSLAPEQRDAYLAQACAGDDSLRLEVAKLLAGDEAARNFLSSPAFVVAAEALAEDKAQRFIGKRLGRFEILSMIGAGGMGEVYLAEDAQLGRRVALKLLPQEFTSHADRLRRFEREARAASALNHPNIITIHDIGETAGIHFIATEYIEGDMLRRRIARGQVSLVEALDVALQVTQALDVAHAAGIIHRDIKPENVMVRPDGIVKVLDFGLAKLSEPTPAKISADSEMATLPISNETTAGMIIGTVQYMSPEQARGVKVDGRSDLWSVGVMLYEMVTGKFPFTGETATDVILSIVDRAPRPLAESAPGLPAELERIVMKALAKNCDERYQSAKDMAIDLKGLKRQLEMKFELARTSPMAEVTPTSTRTGQEKNEVSGESKAPLKKPAASPMTMAIALLLVVTLGLVAWLVFRPNPAAPVSAPASTTTAAPTTPAAFDRQISYSLTITQSNGETYQALGKERFASSDLFSFNFFSAQDGFVYLLNVETQTDGQPLYTLQFPLTKQDAAKLTGNQSISTRRYRFDSGKRTESLLLIWSARPVEELETAKQLINPQAFDAIRDPKLINAVKKFLEQYERYELTVFTDEAAKQTTVQGSGEVLIHTIKLTHN